MNSLPVVPDNQTGRSSSAETSSHDNASQVVRYDASVDQVGDHANRTIQGQHREVGSSRVPTMSGVFNRAHDLDVHGGSFMSAAGNINIYNNVPPPSSPPTGSSSPPQPPASSASPCSDYRSSEIYYRNLITKRRGSPLWIPEPDNASPTYQEKGVSIGDVGRLTPWGSFEFFFNICYPSDHPINSEGVPEGFTPFDSSSLKIRRAQEYGPASYVASESIEISRKQYSNSPAVDLVFESSAAEGAILTMPHGARSENVKYTYPLQGYVRRHIESWYKYIMCVLGSDVGNGGVLVVTGCDKTDSWGVATFVKSAEAVRLTFQPTQPSGHSYKWEYSGSFDARIGPHTNPNIQGPQPVDANLGGGVTSSQPPLNQCLFVRTLSGMLRDDIWKPLKRSACLIWGLDPDEEMVHEGQSFMKGDGHGTIRPGANSTDNPNSMRGGGSGQQRHHLPELEPSVSIVSNVSTATMDHPSKLLNQFLWTNSGHKYPSARVVITEDKDWISVLRDDDLTLPDSEELYRRITAQEQTSGSFLSASFGWRRGDKEHESDSGGNQCYDHKDAGNVYGHCNTHTQRNYTTTSNTAFSMSSGNNILITGRPEFKTINGEYNTYVNTTQTTNVNSNNVIGNTLTNTLYDNSQVIHVKGRGRTRQVRRERRYGRDNVTVNEGHQANAFPPPTSFPTQFPPSHFPGLPNSTTWSSGYVQTFPPPFATPLSSFTHTEDGIVFNIAPGDVEGMGEQSSQLFLKLFGALEAEHFVQAESSTTIPTALAPAASYGSDNSTQSTTYIDLTSGSSYSSPLADNRTAPIEAEMASLSIDEPVQTFVASPFGGQHAAHPDYGASPIESDMAGLSISDPVQTNNAMSPVVAGMANLSLNRPAQSNYALPADGVSAMLKGTILSAASMPDNNVQTSSGRPRIDTRSETPLYGPPATHFTSTLFDSPVSQSPSTHPFLPAQRQTVPTLSYRQSTVSDFGGVQIAPGAHVTSMTFNGLYNEVNHRQTTVNHGMSGMVIGNTVTHVQNLVGEVKEGTTPRKLGKQAHIPMKGKRWAM